MKIIGGTDKDKEDEARKRADALAKAHFRPRHTGPAPPVRAAVNTTIRAIMGAKLRSEAPRAQRALARSGRHARAEGDRMMNRKHALVLAAALLTAAPFSLQWSQENVALSINSAEARIGLTSVAGVHRRVYRRPYRRAAYAAAAAGVAGYGYGSYYGYSSPYYSSYYAPQPYSYPVRVLVRPVRLLVRTTHWPYPPPSDSYYLPPFANVSSYDPRMP